MLTGGCWLLGAAVDYCVSQTANQNRKPSKYDPQSFTWNIGLWTSSQCYLGVINLVPVHCAEIAISHVCVLGTIQDGVSANWAWL